MNRTVRNPRYVHQDGSTMVELLLALPIVMLLGLGIAQFTLVYQAKHALDYALTQAARQGAVAHASPESIRQGLAAGLAPYLYGATDWAALLAAEVRANNHVTQGAAAGWIKLHQRSPSLESFSDWAEPAINAMGEPIAGLVEVPNDNLDNRRFRTQPVSGVAGVHHSEPIGRLSGQTLADANLLRLELVYGVRLAVPVVGSLIIRTLSLWNQCPSSMPPAQSPDHAAARNDRLGLLLLGSVAAQSAAQSWMCEFYHARDREGRVEGRIPVRLSATVRMMSTARRSDMTSARADAASGLTSLGAGHFESDGNEPVSGDRNDGSGRPTSSRGQNDARGGRGGSDNGSGGGREPRSPQAGGPPQNNGFLGIGSDRPYPVPGQHPALCPG